VTTDAIVFTEDQLRIIRESAGNAYPAEACGLITGRAIDDSRIVVHKVIEAENLLAADRQDRFEVDPATRIQVEKACRGTEFSLVAHYHSHPDHPAEPSETDRERAYEPNLIWVIAGVTEETATEIKAHWLDQDGTAFAEIDLIIDPA